MFGHNDGTAQYVTRDRLLIPSYLVRLVAGQKEEVNCDGKRQSAQQCLGLGRHRGHLRRRSQRDEGDELHRDAS